MEPRYAPGAVPESGADTFSSSGEAGADSMGSSECMLIWAGLRCSGAPGGQCGHCVDDDGPGEIEGRLFRLSGRDGNRDQDGRVFHAFDLEQLLFRIPHHDRVGLQEAVGIGHQQAHLRLGHALQDEQRRFGPDLEQNEIPLALKSGQAVGEADHFIGIDAAPSKTGVDLYFFFVSCHSSAATMKSSLLVASARRFSSMTRL